MRNDCFALPPGVNWVPVEEAKARLRDALEPITETELVGIRNASGRVLAEPVLSKRSNPPAPNSAVDGYGFAHGTVPADGSITLPLIKGRSAAGVPFAGKVPEGHAIRILTGAILPEGVDTVVLEEDCEIGQSSIQFARLIKPGSNTRKAGEDKSEGDALFNSGHRLRPQDIGLLAISGLSDVLVYRRLRVAVLSTGDELRETGQSVTAPHQIYDANRPMLLSLIEAWGYEPVDLGLAEDTTEAVRAALDDGAVRADVILTSGGASAGDEDHVSALLKESGSLTSWRIALKPGRPLALALWKGVPVFGLPGNPVAAFVCTLVFGYAALRLMSGAEWEEPRGHMVPAAFAKSKKPGRREYLRARLNAEGHAEVFHSEGSGRVSGLAWADGLVELPDEALEVSDGVLVRYVSYADYGL